MLIKILSFIVSILYKKTITDATCGFRAFKTKIFKKNIKIFNKKNTTPMVMNITVLE